MPKAAEKALKKEAARKFPGDKARQDRYVYGSDVMQKHASKRRKGK